jgi:hypothetical protein
VVQLSVFNDGKATVKLAAGGACDGTIGVNEDQLTFAGATCTGYTPPSSSVFRISFGNESCARIAVIDGQRFVKQDPSCSAPTTTTQKFSSTGSAVN